MRSRTREFPPRPLFPLTGAAVVGFLMAAVPILNGCATGMLTKGSFSDLIGVFVFVLGVVVCLIDVVLARSRPIGRWFLAFGIGLLMGCLSSSLWSFVSMREYRSFDGVSAGSLTFRIASDPSISDGSYSYHADAYDRGGRIGSVCLVIERDMKQGASVKVVGRVTAFGDDDWGRSRFFKREMRRVRTVKVVEVCEGHAPPLMTFRDRMVRLLSRADDRAGPLVAGVVCGRASELKSGDAVDWFSRTGTSHLIAVSGSHLALVCFLAEDFTTRIGMSKRCRSLVMAFAGICYTLFTGASASAVRSCCMVASGLVVGLSGRRRHGISALACTFLILCSLDPAILFDLGFQLSCVSVLGILAFASYATCALAALGLPDVVASPLALTLCAQLATFPLTIPVFGSLSLVAPISNLVIGPVVTALLALGILFTPIAVSLPFASWLLQVPLAAARCVLFLEQVLSSLPFASMSISLSGPMLFLPWLAMAIVYIRWPRPRGRTMAALMLGALVAFGIPLVYWSRFAPASVTVLDVGQADAILIRQGSATLLVDSGVDERIIDALARQHVHRLDAVLITHWDEDHWGGLPSVLEQVPVGRILVAEGAESFAPDEVARSGIPVEGLSHGDVLSIGDFRARVVWPCEEVAGEENGDSLCMKLSYRMGSAALSVLLTGDSEIEQEHIYASEVGDVDVLKVGHHGSKVSVDEMLLDEIEPEVCIASAGEGNRYGHPSRECRDAVLGHGSDFLCTIESGDISVFPGKGGPRVAVQKGTLGRAEVSVP